MTHYRCYLCDTWSADAVGEPCGRCRGALPPARTEVVSETPNPYIALLLESGWRFHAKVDGVRVVGIDDTVTLVRGGLFMRVPAWSKSMDPTEER